MKSNFAWTLALAALIVWVVPVSSSAAPLPKPKSTHAPAKRFEVDGGLRAYIFDKTQYSKVTAFGGKPTPNQHAMNFGLRLHARYEVSPHVTLGATYYGAEPFYVNGPCSQVSNYHPGGSCNAALSSRVDNTLPAYALSTLGEAYFDYHAKGAHVRVGNQLINTPWAQPIDGRIKPNLFQGITGDFGVAKNLTLSIDRIARFESRTSSAFLPTTFVTKPGQFVSGMLYSSLAYKGPRSPLTAMVGLYNFYNIANLLYTEEHVALARTSPLAPTLGLQYMTENTAGHAYAGIVQNQTFGMQGTAHLGRNFNFSVGIDTAPWRSRTVNASSAAAAEAGLFLPAGGSPIVYANGSGLYTVYYGGVASPYTGAYAGDALFTSIPTGSMAQRQSAGSSSKIALGFKTNNTRFQGQLAEARFDFTNGAGSENTKVDLAEAVYFFGPKIAKGFHGLSLRDRYIVRTQTNVPPFGGLPTLQYNRVQFEYTF